MTSAPAETPAPPPRKPRRLGLYLPFVLLALVFAAWSAFWLYASNQTGKLLESWMAREAALGRHWSCPDRDVEGYPFNIIVKCNGPSFEGRIGPWQASGQVAAIRAIAQVYQPTLVLVEMDGPLTVRSTGDGPSLDLAWSHMRASLHGSPAGLSRLDLVLDNPDLNLKMQGQTFAGQAAHLETHLRRDPKRPAQDRAYDWAFDLENALVPALDTLVRSQAPLTASGQGVVTQARFTGEGTPAEKLEAWRADGGDLQIDKLHAQKGAASLDAHGTVSLDAFHRPQGRIEARVAGLDPLLQRFGVPVSVAAIDNLLGGLLGGHAARRGAPSQDAISLPLVLADGRVRMGPFVLPAVLPPLY